MGKHEQPQDLNINSWTFLVNCVCQSVSVLSITSVFFVSVLIYETVKDRIDGYSVDLVLRWWSPAVHIVACLGQSMLYLPLFFFLASGAEWIAAIKSLKGHKFAYDVAPKGIPKP